MAYRPGDPRQKEAVRRYYLKNKHIYIARNKAKFHKIKSWLIEQKNRPCQDCAIKYPYYVMDFDHRPGEQKFYDPNSLARRLSWKKAREEIAKCDIVCSNCHRERTFRRAKQVPQPLTKSPNTLMQL